MRYLPAPIVFFAYNRPEHTSKTLAALAANPEARVSDLHIFIDGPRGDGDELRVAEVSEVARAFTGFGSIRVHQAKANRGLYRSITEGVSSVISSNGRVIVVEDDILVAPFFLTYMNDALDLYSDDARVGSIHAYSPAVRGLPDFFFLRGGDCWGWATWKDRWALFDADARNLMRRLVHENKLGDFAAVQGIQVLHHLVKRARNRNQSWAAHWNASLFLEGRITLHPGRSLVQNTGNDGTGTHAGSTVQYGTEMSGGFDGIPEIPVLEDRQCATLLRRFYDGLSPLPFGRVGAFVYREILKARGRALARSTK